MARYATTIDSRLSPDDAFAYMADFSHAREWDPTVSRAERTGDGPLVAGSQFDLVARFGGRDVPLRYTLVEFEPPRRIVLEAPGKGFVSRDAVTVEPASTGSRISYDARLEFSGPRRLLEPLMQRIFTRVGDDAAAGLRRALNP